MNRLKISILLAASIGISVQAVNLHTDALCNDLKKAIECGQSVENTKEVFEKIITASKLTAPDQTDLAAQVVSYAQEQKENTQKNLAALGSKTYNVSNLAWGSAQLGGAIGCAALLCKVAQIYVNRTSGDLFDIFNYLRLSDFYWKYLAEHIEDNWVGVPKGAKVIAPLELIAYTAAVPYLFYKGAKNLRAGIYYKKSLEDTIAQLDAIIDYFKDNGGTL